MNPLLQVVASESDIFTFELTHPMGYFEELRRNAYFHSYLVDSVKTVKL